MRFPNREEAGRSLAAALQTYIHEDVVVYALPRGGVVLGAEVAKYLKAPLDLAIPRKVIHPDHASYAVCAITEDGHLVCDREEAARLDSTWLANEVQKEQTEAKRNRQTYLADRAAVPTKGKTALLVDDGIATGLTMVAAVQEVKDREPSNIVIAVPVAPSDIARHLERYVDDMIVLHVPPMFLGSVSAYYDDFSPVDDKQIIDLIKSV